MGINCYFYLRVGYSISADEVANVLLCKEDVPGVFHMEDRFDPKTGAKVSQEKVWDQRPYSIYKFKHASMGEGEQFNSDYDRLEDALKKDLGCNVEFVFDIEGDHSFNIFPHDVGKRTLDCDRVSVFNGSMDYEVVWSLKDELNRIKKRLIELGFKVGNPQVFISNWIG